MKKTLLATAIAGAMVVSASASAATVYNQDGTKLDLYGNIQIAYSNIDQGDESTDQIADNGSTFGFAAEHAITSDLAGYLKLEFDDFQADEKKNTSRDTGDQAYVGLKGSFGDARLGSYDPLIDDWIQDPISNNEYFDNTDSNQNIAGVADSREGNKLTYTSPSFGGLQFAVGTQYEGDGEGDRTASFDAGAGEFAGQEFEVETDGDSNASFFGGAKYTAGAFSIAAVYDNLANNDGEYTGSNTNASGDFDAGDQYGITAQYTMNALRLAAKVERFKSDNDLVQDVNYYGLGARYGYGMGDVYGSYQYVDVGGSDLTDAADDAFTSGDWPNEEGESYNEVILGATYNISSAMYTWAEVAMYDREADEGDGFATGITYLF